MNNIRKGTRPEFDKRNRLIIPVVEIAKILKTNNVYLNENSNGIFVNLNKISFSVYNDICNYIDFIKKQESDINKDEKSKLVKILIQPFHRVH